MSHSRSQVDRTGDRIRHALRRGELALAEDLAVVEEYRDLFVPRLVEIQKILEHARDTAANTLVRDLVVDEETFHVASRPKTTPAIVAKLARGTTRLSLMQDIAGGRIVVPLLWMQDAVVESLVELLTPMSPRLKDTRDEGDALGYRAVHITFRIDGLPAEIQVRDGRQQAWAQTVERIDRRFGWDLKHGVGPPEWLHWLRATSDVLRSNDLGVDLPFPPLPEP